ncbi:NAD(P)-dependent oxidoreductase [Anianabacter salinae]|uniref:NAD(P)-dependent oxidoreductase n=1 Tax=Anianabacter salinae TaxID=2851023 RepID=UPI00225E5620|nr:DUF1932 domain-containing protein [Anianabacter salinae]MBV0911999.1 DUF1932 domain-containing protein [Anianabacter salinae]
MKIAFLGYGEAARAFAATLGAEANAPAFTAYDIKLDGPLAQDMRAAMAADGVAVADTPAALAGANWLISAVTADQSLKAATAALGALREGMVFVDINSVSPGRKQETAAAVADTGATYLDMAVMAPVHPRGHRTPVLVAGAVAQAEPALTALGFDWSMAGDGVGDATAIKMIRSNFVKGLEAITVETLLAAEAAGVLDTILASLSKSYPGLGWPDHAAYQFERTLVHGARRAAEMEESAATLDALGLTGALGRATAEVQRAMGRAGEIAAPSGDLADTVRRTLAARRR